MLVMEKHWRILCREATWSDLERSSKDFISQQCRQYLGDQVCKRMRQRAGQRENKEAMVQARADEGFPHNSSQTKLPLVPHLKTTISCCMVSFIIFYFFILFVLIARNVLTNPNPDSSTHANSVQIICVLWVFPETPKGKISSYSNPYNNLSLVVCLIHVYYLFQEHKLREKREI